MKVSSMELPRGKTRHLNIFKQVILSVLAFILLTTLIHLYLYKNSHSSLLSIGINTSDLVTLLQKNTSLLLSIGINNSDSVTLLQKNTSLYPPPLLSIGINNSDSVTLLQKNTSFYPPPLLSIEINTSDSVTLLQKNTSLYPPPSLSIGISTSDSVTPLQKNTSYPPPPLPPPPPPPPPSSSSSLHFPKNYTSNDSTSIKKCDIFRGKWVPSTTEGPYYTNETQCEIHDQQNCMKYGRPDTQYLNWRWKPDECSLPLFDAVQFLELVRGKSLAFIGDSLGRNQMQSLACLLASTASRAEVSYDEIQYCRRWIYRDYNFTISHFWSPLLVKGHNTAPNSNFSGNDMHLYLDEAEAWSTHIEDADIVIFSAGQWFFRQFMYYENGKVVGCNACNENNITDLGMYYGYKMAFRTAFKTLMSLENFTGLTIMSTFSPAHYENGEWNKGGNCARTNPFMKGEVKLEWYNLEFYKTQVEELRAAEVEGRKRRLKFAMLDTTEAMLMRPDGHPSRYGHSPAENITIADCIHWCLPGPVDTSNELLLQILKMEEDRGTINRKL